MPSLSSSGGVYRRPLLSDVDVKPDLVGEYGCGDDNERKEHTDLRGRRSIRCISGAYYRQMKALMRWYLDYAHATFRIRFDDVVIVTTIYVILADSMRQLWAPVSADIYFIFCTSLCFFLFGIELLVTTWAKTSISILPSKVSSSHMISPQLCGPDKNSNGQLQPVSVRSLRKNQLRTWMSPFEWVRRIRIEGFLFSYWFWLDALSVVSLIIDLPWLIPSALEDKRTGNLWRVLRMVRLVRLVRLYQIASNRTRESRIIEGLQDLVDKGLMSEEEVDEKITINRLMQRQSKVGGELSDCIMKRVISGIFLMLCLVPLLTVNQENNVDPYGTEMLQNYNVLGDEASLELATATYVSALGETTKGEEALMYLEFQPGDRVIVDLDTDDYRSYELESYYFSDVVDGVVYSTHSTFNEREMYNLIAAYDLLMTAFAALMLALGVVLLNNDARRLVLAPIERMMEIIEYVALDPLQEDQQVIVNEGVDRTGEYEMKLLETAITKITGLLRVGFGVAGAEIISKNLRIDGANSSVLDPMIPGKRVYSIYGFCDIHRFEFVTESLREEVMTFINVVAAIVHASTCAWDGECNKNLGNSFLLVWRIGEAEEVLHASQVARIDAKKSLNSPPNSPSGTGASRTSNPSATQGGSGYMSKREKDGDRPILTRKQSVNLQRIPGVDVLADKALISFIKCIHEISTSSKIKAYEKQKRLASGSRDGVFKLNMGFGLHTGWSIEGAVGSQQKVDATYLSPHVNMTARMETASRQYGVRILFTDDFYKLLSKSGQAVVRQLDVVTVKGSMIPMPIYTYDTHVTDTLVPRLDEGNIEAEMEEESRNYSSNIWTEDRQLLKMRCLCTPTFMGYFREGVKDYIAGSWAKAAESLKHADELKLSYGCTSGDGPSRTLLKFMANRNNEAPADWKGFRELDSK